MNKIYFTLLYLYRISITIFLLFIVSIRNNRRELEKRLFCEGVKYSYLIIELFKYTIWFSLQKEGLNV